jgi:subtilisin family serine protease
MVSRRQSGDQEPRVPDRWRESLRFTAGAGGYAYRAGEIIVDESALEDARDVARRDMSVERIVDSLVLITDAPQPINFAAALRARGHRAQVNHAVFATNVAFGNPAAYGNPGAYGNPAAYGNPGAYGNPWHGPGCVPTGCGCDVTTSVQKRSAPHRSTARRAPASRELLRALDEAHAKASSGLPRVKICVLDSGVVADEYGGDLAHIIKRDPEPWGPTKPGVLEDNVDPPDEDGDLWLDPIAGHGTFIASLITRLAPQADVHVSRVLEGTGEGDDADIASRIDLLTKEPPAILCLSLSCVTEDDKPPLGLATAIAKLQRLGTVVVASAGNDASCRVVWPAALPDVISVAALGPYGPAPFTNFGPWVQACAPGLDVVSRFFDGIDEERDGLRQTADFFGWATWSGTSFAAPIVAGAIAREIGLYGLTAEQAADRVVFDERLFRLPGLGTVVNLH